MKCENFHDFFFMICYFFFCVWNDERFSCSLIKLTFTFSEMVRKWDQSKQKKVIIGNIN